MKKITLQIFGFLCLFSTLSFGQTYTTGLFDVWGVIEGQIDINVPGDLVTLTLIGPDNSYLTMGFDTDWHWSGKDVVIFDEFNLTDRSFTGSQELPNGEEEQDWTITSNVTSAGSRTIVATRTRDTGHANDFVFPTTGEIFVAGSHGNNTFNLNHHGSADFKLVSITEVLGIDGVNQINFSMSPNPATSNLKIVLPSNLTNSSVEIFDMLARKIFDGKMLNTHFSIIDVSAWTSGVYLVKVSNNDSSQTKRFIRQ